MKRLLIFIFDNSERLSNFMFKIVIVLSASRLMSALYFIVQGDHTKEAFRESFSATMFLLTQTIIFIGILVLRIYFKGMAEEYIDPDQKLCEVTTFK